MKKFTGLLLGSCLLFGGLGMAVAQEPPPPPKVLAIFREFVKPGKSGSLHEKSESAFVQAMTRAQWPTHYLAVNSITGKPRTLFLTGYDSFADWEKDVLAEQANATLSAATEKAAVADGELLSDADASALVYREDYSLRSSVDIPHMRYFEISLYRVRPGHDQDFDAIVKMVKAAYEKISDVRFATYRALYGQEGNTYIVFTPMKSAAEIDRDFDHSKQFMANMGEDGMKKFSELMAAAIETSQHNLFAFSPSMSYVSDEWIKADPDFWKPKPHAAAPKKTEEKPANSR
ncbi:MAG TPA: hypothetical protein VK513_11060 [Terriglobales bacterium]|jgi:hypothetical protein|nr:hypothetical protein [Terriglobales bacterium]